MNCDKAFNFFPFHFINIKYRLHLVKYYIWLRKRGGVKDRKNERNELESEKQNPKVTAYAYKHKYTEKRKDF